MVSKKIYTSREQKAIKKKYGGYIKVNDGVLKLVIRCGGTDYKSKSIVLYSKIKKLLEYENYILENVQ